MIMGDLEAFGKIADFVNGNRHGVCAVCRRGYSLNLDGNVRNHYANKIAWCDGGGKPPLEIPETELLLAEIASLRQRLGEVHPFDDAERYALAALRSESNMLEAGLTARGVEFCTPFDVDLPTPAEAALCEIDRLRANQARLAALEWAARQWRAQFVKPAETKPPRMSRLIAAVDALDVTDAARAVPAGAVPPEGD